MPNPVYVDLLTQESEKRLAALVRDIPHPVTLAGGHAVRLRVQERWFERHQQGYGIVRWHTVGTNQRGETVIEFDRTNLVRRRATTA